MGTRSQEIEVNQTIAGHLHWLIQKSGRLTMIFVLLTTLVLCGGYYITQMQLTNASGVFEIPIEHNKVMGSPLSDHAHIFDDNVAKIQNYTAQKLTTLLNKTTSSYRYIDEGLESTSASFRNDLDVNFQRYNIQEQLTDEKNLHSMNFDLVDVPIVVNAISSDKRELSDIPFDELNNVHFDVYRLEITAKFNIKSNTNHTNVKHTINFYVDVKPINQDQFQLIGMTTWK